MDKPGKNIHEVFTQFFEKPSREYLRSLLQLHSGESDQLDFKQEWPSCSRLAKHLLGLANSGGGCIVIGVLQAADNTFNPIGLPRLKDKADLNNGVRKYLPQQLGYEILDFAYESSEYKALQGRKFQVVLVDDKPQYIPFVSQSEDDDLRYPGIYVRRGTTTVEANYQELQEIINRRLATRYSSEEEFSLERELAELQLLYNRIPRSKPIDLSPLLGALQQNNPEYPAETIDGYINRLIEVKKKRIEELLKHI